MIGMLIDRKMGLLVCLCVYIYDNISYISIQILYIYIYANILILSCIILKYYVVLKSLSVKHANIALNEIGICRITITL